MSLRNYLNTVFEQSLAELGHKDAPAMVKQASKPEFGHYQANGIMGASKQAGANPRALAGKVAKQVLNGGLDGQMKLEVAGPGFINISLTPEFVATRLETLDQDERLGLARAGPEKILIDYSSPNLAKEMHIGHLRSTAIGDAAARILEFLGHRVIRANHVGDWGVQFGSLLAYMDKLESAGDPLTTELKDLEVFYQKAAALLESSDGFASRAREFAVRLQLGDEKCLSLWSRFVEESMRHCQAIYDLLDISLTPGDAMAESAYRDQVQDTLAELDRQGLITVSDEALCVFLDEFVGKDGEPIPAIVQKSDGGYPYMATDLAAARYRGRELEVDRALYFVDGRQSLHLSQLFAIAGKAGFIREGQNFRHIPFGTILNKKGRPFKTREGGAVKLADVAEEAISRAHSLISDRNPDLTAEEKGHIARVVGIGAIKYAELSKNRTTDYIFDWDTMLSFEGNTAPYLQYAYTRIRSIFRRADIDPGAQKQPFILDDEAELLLAIKLLQYPETIESVIEDYQANILCNYLFELSRLFMSFYESCPVLKAEDSMRASRLRLCALSARTLQHGLGLLGIATVERM